MTEKEYLFMLNHVMGMGAVTLFQLLEYFGSYQGIWKSKKEELEKTKCLTAKRISALFECRKKEDQMLKEYENLTSKNIRYITYYEKEYPSRLKPYRDRPTGLFVKGRLPKDDIPTVSIVGARNCTEYGRDTAESMAFELAQYGIQVVSGLAVGTDSAAHIGCLNANGDTFAVLGCGVNICYPKINYKLFEEIERNGGIISEFVPGTEPLAGNFPMRNRIISGLADVVLIVEAREKSGSLITGNLALEQGKEVFAVPGRIHDPLSAGCNRLLQDGAGICIDPKDILDVFGIREMGKIAESKKIEKALAKNENMVYSFLDSRPKTLEEIVTFCQISVSEALECLTTLELNGWIKSDGNQYYCRKM